MFFDGRIYFLSDRDGSMNIWSMVLDGNDKKQHTHTIEWDYYEADMDNGRIAFQRGADLQVFDILTNSTSTPDIKIISDFDQMRIKWLTNPMDKVSSISLSQSGDEVAFTARGRVFTVPSVGERWSEVTRGSGIRYKVASFENKNELFMLSDESGEFEIWKVEKEGLKQITSGSKNQIDGFSVSPDGNSILYTEKDNKLLLYTIKTGKKKLIRTGSDRFGGGIEWSSDSKWAVFKDALGNGNSQVMLLNLATEKAHQITSSNFDNYGGSFSADGKWLYFVSDRTFKNETGGPWGVRQPEPYYNKTGKIYALALDQTAKFPFMENNELNKEKEPEKEGEDSKKKSKDVLTLKPITVDMDGLSSRLYEVPMDGANIGDCFITDSYIYWSEFNSSNRKATLKALKMSGASDNEVIDIAEDVKAASMSGDRSKVLIKLKAGIFVIGTDGSKLNTEKGGVKMDKWSFSIDPVEDWKQMFLDAWRMERDYFYDVNMHGVDWDKMYAQYEPLLSRVKDRHELDDLMAQMVSELSTLHTFVYGGDKRRSEEKTSIGHLGARITKDIAAKGYRIEHVYRGDLNYPNSLSPLGKTQTKIQEGELITHVNDVNVMDVDHINMLLTNKSGLQTKLTMTNAEGTSYEEIVTPISNRDASNLKYTEWELTRAEAVTKESEDRIGYVHLRAMGRDNYTEWMKGFYPSFNKEGLIIDVRHNRGGNIDSWILARLLRQEWFFWAPRVGAPSWNMQSTFRGHVVVLMDEQTASDGEAFSEGFRTLELGQLIGMRTWGGEVWLSSGNRLVDNGIATAAEFGVFDEDGNWLIEGIGVIPDITVENMPAATFKGEDAQLDRAIKHLQIKMKEDPIVVPEIPKYPNKSVDYNKR